MGTFKHDNFIYSRGIFDIKVDAVVDQVLFFTLASHAVLFGLGSRQTSPSSTNITTSRWTDGETYQTQTIWAHYRTPSEWPCHPYSYEHDHELRRASDMDAHYDSDRPTDPNSQPVRGWNLWATDTRWDPTDNCMKACIHAESPDHRNTILTPWWSNIGRRLIIMTIRLHTRSPRARGRVLTTNRMHVMTWKRGW